MKHYHRNTVAEQETTGCITEMHQCGPCAYNTVCSASTQMAQNDPSASDWQDGTLALILIPLDFN